jgi:uridine kinase
MKYNTIGISGQSASGKTFFLKILMSLLNNESYSYIDLDGYHYHGREERKRLCEFPEDINANNVERIIEDIKKIKNGRIIETPTYNHQLGKIENITRVAPKSIIFVEGLHTTSLNDLAKEKIIDFSIHINPSVDLQHAWKVHRDVLERGYNFDTVMKEIDGRKTYEKKFVLPQKQKSDVLINISEVDFLIKHVLLIAQTHEIACTDGFKRLFKVTPIEDSNKKYLHLTQQDEYRKLLYKLDHSGLLKFDKTTLKKVNENSNEYIAQISLGLILFLKACNYEYC